jgi:hypothetical protein
LSNVTVLVLLLFIKVEVERARDGYVAAIGKSLKTFCKKGEKKKNDPKKGQKEHLERIERESVKIMKTAALCYETNRVINLIVVGIGVVLISNSIAYGWTHGVNQWSLFSGGLGIISFVTLFFTKPQQYITNALGNLAQIQVIYKSYCLQIDAMLDYHVRNESASIEEIVAVNEVLQSITDKAIKLIQYNVESETEKRSFESVNGNGKKALIIEKSSTSDKVGNSVR